MESFIDGVDPAEQFYERLLGAERPPTTATPSPGDFLAIYRRLATGAEAIISIHLMESKSTLINVARMAAQMEPDLPIHVVDSESTTLGLGLITIAAAKAAKAGASVAEILDRLQRLVRQTSAHAVIREMTQLRRSGRVSLGQALIANALSIKPILYIGQGVIEVAGKVRGWSGAIERMIEMAQERAGDARVAIAVVHTNAEAEAQQVLERVKDRFNVAEAMVAEAGPALATHAGAGAVGIATLQID